MVDEEPGPEAVKPPHEPRWHLAHTEAPRTLCGLPILYGSARTRWTATPADERCAVCVRRLAV